MQGGVITTHSSSLAQVVCDWAPSKLAELAKQLAASCSPPEVSFSSYNSYRAYFEPLLLAEVAAELLSATEKYHRSNPVRQPKVRARREDPGTSSALVVVHKVTRQHTAGFGWVVDVDSHDRKGPVGSVDNDVVACWPAHPPSKNHSSKFPSSAKNTSHVHHHQQQRFIPDNAVLAVVVRNTKRTGCRLLLSKFPDGNESGIRTDLEEGEENEDEPPALRLWNVLRLGPLITMKREFDALRQIKTSVLMPTLLRPKIQNSDKLCRPSQIPVPAPDPSVQTGQLSQVTDGSATNIFQNEQWFTHIIARKAGLNASQTRAVLHASTCRNGFSIIQGPPGTGKTRTLISLLNVIHMTEYQKYYESILASYKHIFKRNSQDVASAKETKKPDPSSRTEKRGNNSLLETMMLQMNKTMSTSTEEAPVQLPAPAQRPRLLVCAPSNSAVDEILTRLTKCKFFDGQGREYCPELARIGADDRVSESAKPFTAEGQAEAFLDRVCADDMNADARKKAQMAFMSTWQSRCNTLLNQLAMTPKRDATSHTKVIDLHEKLERMERDLRRLTIAASDGPKELSREEKLRQIARTYVEDAQLVFATLSGSASSILTKKGFNDMSDHEGALFDTVVIDEGAQATETSCLIPLTLGASRCLIVGDPQQLPATVLSSGAAGLAYGQSLLERICRGGQNVQLLDTQYRMHPAISSFPRRHFYNGKLLDDESVQGENRAKPYHRDAIRPKLGPYVFLDISEGEETRTKDDKSIFNRAEAELASLIYTKLKKEYSNDTIFSTAAKAHGSVLGFGVVTPYKRQMQELRQSFDRAGIPTGDVEVDTVDSYQGREKDVIVFSCVRTSAVNRGIGFVRDVRRMNVGLTRARSSLIILGSAQALSEGSADWAELIEDANSRGCLINVSNVQKCLYPALPSVKTGVVSENGLNSKVESNQHAVVASTPTMINAASGISVTALPQDLIGTASRVQTLPGANNPAGSRPTDPRLTISRTAVNPHITVDPRSALDSHKTAVNPRAPLDPLNSMNRHATLNPHTGINHHVEVNPLAPLDTKAAKSAHVRRISNAMVRQNLGNTVSRPQTLSTNRNPSGSHPSDPRLRAAKRAAASKPQAINHTPLHQSSDSGIGGNASQLISQPAEVAPSMNDNGGDFRQGNVILDGMGLSSQSHGIANGSMNGTEDVNQPDGGQNSLQSTVEQMSAILADGGFQNTTAVKEALLEHLMRGGELDVETVMAAAIANNSLSNGKTEAKNAAVQPPPTSVTPHLGASTLSSGNGGESNERTRIQRQPPPKSESVRPRPSQNFPPQKKMRQMEQKNSSDQGAKSRATNDSSRGEKSSGREKSADRKTHTNQSTAPSGWDMLFASKNAPKRADTEDQLGARTNTKPRTELRVKDEPSEASERVEKSKANDVQTGRAAEPGTNNAKTTKGTEQFENGGQKARKNWNEDDRETEKKRPRLKDFGNGSNNGHDFDRKRSRQNDYRGGFNSRSHGRGDRGRIRPKRGRGRDGVADATSHEVFSGNDVWRAPVQFDPNLLQYQAIGAGFDPSMGPPTQTMNALYMQHQAMQQALHQQAFQQMQQYQQQEAYRQQQTFTQMPGMAHVVGPPQYADYDGGYSGGVTRGNSGRGSSWMHGHGGGRGGRSGRGRGRSKYGGRGKRDH